jgi:hypothetical protein
MPRYSETFTLPDGTRGIVCFSGKRKTKPCRMCRKPSSLLCDWPVSGKTCDAPLCRGCAVSPTAGVDHCPHHTMPEAGDD